MPDGKAGFEQVLVQPARAMLGYDGVVNVRIYLLSPVVEDLCITDNGYAQAFGLLSRPHLAALVHVVDEQAAGVREAGRVVHSDIRSQPFAAGLEVSLAALAVDAHEDERAAVSWVAHDLCGVYAFGLQPM